MAVNNKTAAKAAAKEQAPLLMITPSPHFHQRISTRMLMTDVLIALVPSVLAATLFYGPRTLLLLAVSITVCVLSEYVSRRVMRRSNTIGDLSAVVTAVILVMNVPVSMPLWQLALGAVAAIVVAKQIFGGIGQNFVNPAMIARIMLVTSFGSSFMRYSTPDFMIKHGLVDHVSDLSKVDAITSASPLTALKLGAEGVANAPSLKDMIFGLHSTAAIGETCSIAILIGLAYLLIRKVIKIHIPLAYVGTVAILSLLYGGFDFNFMIYQILAGGLLFGAVFMATDYSTSPLTDKGKIIFGIGLGVITCLIRFWGSLPEGVSYSIVLMNIFTTHIDNWTRTPIFGAKEAEQLQKEAQG